MASKTIVPLTFSLAMAALAWTGVGTAEAEQPGPSAIVVTAPWLRATPKNAPVAGGYLTVTNKGPSTDRLVGASLPMASDGQVHTMTMKNGVMHMERLDGLAIAPGATVTLSPGGRHLMFTKPSMPLKEGETIDGTLVFEKAGKVAVTFKVGGMAAKQAPGAPGHEDMAMPDMKGMNMKGMDMKDSLAH